MMNCDDTAVLNGAIILYYKIGNDYCDANFYLWKFRQLVNCLIVIGCTKQIGGFIFDQLPSIAIFFYVLYYTDLTNLHSYIWKLSDSMLT